MTCIDCSEPIVESERRGASTCVKCKGQMHGECAMATVLEDDICEGCHDKYAIDLRRYGKVVACA